MLIHRDTLRAALLATTDDDPRYFMDAVCVRPDGTVEATNGHILVRAQDAARIPEEDFPTGHRAQQATPYDHDPSVGVVIASKVVERAIAQTPKKSALPVLACVQLGCTAGEETYLAATDLEAAQVQIVEPPPSAYPRTDHVWITDARPHLTVQISGVYLETLAKLAKLAARKGHPFGGVVELQIPTEAQYQDTRTDAGGDRVPTGEILAPIRFKTGAGGGETRVEGLVMPCRP